MRQIEISVDLLCQFLRSGSEHKFRIDKGISEYETMGEVESWEKVKPLD